MVASLATRTVLLWQEERKAPEGTDAIAQLKLTVTRQIAALNSVS